MMLWCEMTAPDGEPMLVNMELTAAIKRDKATGLAIAVTIVGAPVALGEKFETVAADLLDPLPDVPMPQGMDTK